MSDVKGRLGGRGDPRYADTTGGSQQQAETVGESLDLPEVL